MPLTWFGRIFVCSVVSALGAGAILANPAADPLETVMARMDQAAAGFKGLTADIHKIAHTDVVNVDDPDSGTIVVKKYKSGDTRIRIDFTAPRKQSVAIGNGRAIVYYPQTNEANEVDLGKNRGLVDQFMLLGFGSNSSELKNAYSLSMGGSDTVNGEKTTRIQLIPKDKEVLAHVKSCELWISDKGWMVQQKFHTGGGDYILSTYSHINWNAPIADKDVKVDLPKGVQNYQAEVGVVVAGMEHPKTSAYRLEYLDWVRGLGALIMLQGHVFHSFLRPELKTTGAYMLSQFVGGMPPALFLFLTGVTLAFLMDSIERKGMAPRQRVFQSLLRARYLFFLAFAFRVQLWVFAGMSSPWQAIFKVDVLNCMGMSIALLSVMALFKTSERIRLCAALGLAIALLSPIVSDMDWSGVPWLVRDYLVPDYNSFGIFPWGAYLAFGVSAGSIIRALPREGTERCMQWAALVGGTLILLCQYLSNTSLTIYAKSEYWLNSPAQVLTKVGVLYLMVAFAYLWTRYGAGGGWSWVRQFGVTSLLVYWVHIELVYGHASYLWKDNLNVAQTATAAVIVILMMLALSTMKTHRDKWLGLLSNLGLSFRTPRPDPAAGD